MSLRPNGTASKCPRAHMTLRANVLAPKCLRPDVSRPNVGFFAGVYPRWDENIALKTCSGHFYINLPHYA